MTFDEWFKALTDLDKDNIINKDDQESYKDYYDDGDSPEETIEMEAISLGD